MKHEKEWYTCDRCNKEIKPNKQGLIIAEAYKNKESCLGDYIMDKMFKCDLCPACWKEFERFMRNERL